ncbi:uncharacterized protein LOC113520380 isoform X2 [Galleria mellonella]|uniref:DNA repair protein RAD51 homolog 3 n=1 Tax=Galleria mellonella TaxID=7137 RepID=A0A6J3CCV6_GALME|nr:uncharacterized protein LOC113520380 isoform X2 [Galleria mellonella]
MQVNQCKKQFMEEDHKYFNVFNYSIQLCASVQIPKSLGGLDAEALYIDTNTHFTPYRFKDIVTASLKKCQMVLNCPIVTSEEDVLKRLHYVNAFGIEKFCAFMHTLSRFVDEHPNIRLIVIDSIAFPYKEGISAGQRTGLLFRQMAELQRLAMEKQIAVVLTNEMSTRVGLSTGSVVGSLGDAWAHRCNKRILLSVINNSCERLALSLKSNNSPNNVGRFKITQEGIRDVE